MQFPKSGIPEATDPSQVLTSIQKSSASNPLRRGRDHVASHRTESCVPRREHLGASFNKEKPNSSDAFL